MQITWKQAEDIAAKAASQSLGIIQPRGPITMTADQVQEIARRGAMHALRLAGLLQRSDAEDRARDERMSRRSPQIA